MIDDETKKWLRATFGQAVRFDEPLARYTSFKIGGPADALVEPESPAQIGRLVQWSRDRNIPYMIMGGGTNMLIADNGLRGVTIRLNRLVAPMQWNREQTGLRLTVAAGTPTKRVCALALRQGWQGMNFALGIPGLLGGAVCMNAGTAAGDMAGVLEALTVVDSKGETVRLEKADLAFGYRHIVLPAALTGDHNHPAVVVQAELNLMPEDKTLLRDQACRFMRVRGRTQPAGAHSAGSFFKNPSTQMPAGRLIDEAGLKGASVGDAQVSLQHANFIINRGRAKAADVLRLTTLVQETVRNRFGIDLQPEVRIVGQA